MEAVDFSRVVIRIPSSKVIGKIQGSWICNKIDDFRLDNNNFTPANVFFADEFVEEFSNSNFNILGS